MSTSTSTSKSASETQQQIERLRAKADFLARYRDALDALTYTGQQDAERSQTGEPYPKVLAYVTVDATWSHYDEDAREVVGQVDVRVNGDDDPAVRGLVRHLRRALGGGMWRKDGTDYTFTLARRIDDIWVEISSSREKVCEKVVVGTEEKVLPAVEARPERTETVEKIEWRCAPVGG